MSNVIIRDLIKKYASFTAVKGVSLNVAQGELVTLLGSSGCGKTTTLRCVAGLEMPDGGEIFFDERPISNVPPHLRSCGMVFQNYALFPHMTVEENLAYGLMAARFRGAGWLQRFGILMQSPLACLDADERKRIGESIEVVELGAYRTRKPGQLSGGQQQRVALARAMITQPKVLLFDEPLGALDAQLRVKMREEIRRMQRRAGITTLYVTHDQEEALAISDRIAVMNKGLIEQLGSPEDIYKRPKTRFIADFIGLENIYDARRGDGAALIGNNLSITVDKLPTEETFTLALRPESLRFVGRDEAPQNVIEGIVTLRMFMGTAVKYVVKAGNIEIVAKMPEQQAGEVAMDDRVRLTVTPSEVLVMADAGAPAPALAAVS